MLNTAAMLSVESRALMGPVAFHNIPRVRDGVRRGAIWSGWERRGEHEQYSRWQRQVRNVF